MSSPSISLYNTTDETFHISEIDEVAIRVVATRVSTSAFWLGVLTTLVIALVLLSTSQQRRGPIFIFQCLAFVLAIAYNILVYIRAVWRHQSTFRMPDEPYDPRRENRAQTTVLLIEHWIPLIADIAVIFKIMGFYPSQLYNLKSRILRLTPPIFLLLSRAALICYLTYIANAIYTQASSLSGQVKQVIRLDLVDLFVYIGTTIFAIEAAFCLYTSCFLIFKICQFYFNLKQQDGKAIRRKSRLFMEITCMTFIPPLVLSIACAVLLYQEDSGPSKYRDAVAALANISVVFSLLASSWSTIRSHNNVQNENEDKTNITSRGEISLVSKICLRLQQQDRFFLNSTKQSQRTTLEGQITPPVEVSMYHLNDDAVSSANHFKSWTEEVAESMPLATISPSSSKREEHHPLPSVCTG